LGLYVVTSYKYSVADELLLELLVLSSPGFPRLELKLQSDPIRILEDEQKG